MYLQAEDTEGTIDSDEQSRKKTNEKENSDKVRKEHDKWMRLRKRIKCTEFSNRSYWQIKSNSAIL
jgi:hypothetical protein